MYGCESWTIKKAEHQRIDAFEIVVLEKSLDSPLDSKEIKPVNPKRKLSNLKFPEKQAWNRQKWESGSAN